MRKVNLKLCKSCVKGSCCRHGVSVCLFEVAAVSLPGISLLEEEGAA